jgi:hypothetical protein
LQKNKIQFYFSQSTQNLFVAIRLLLRDPCIIRSEIHFQLCIEAQPVEILLDRKGPFYFYFEQRMIHMIAKIKIELKF